jgi:hypothetical protein
MKRPSSGKLAHLLHGDIERDLTQAQLAKIGAISFAYNNAEHAITKLFGAAIGLNAQMLLEVCTRINGTEGRIAIILEGAKQRLFVSKELQRLLEDSLGENGFAGLKKYREAVIHARLVSSPLAVGKTVERRAKTNEVLLSQKALDALYEHLKAITAELESASGVLIMVAASKDLVPEPSARKKELAAAVESIVLAQYRENHKKRLALQPIPEFPQESESEELASQWIEESLAAMKEKVPALAQVKWPDPPYRTLYEVMLLTFAPYLLDQAEPGQK